MGEERPDYAAVLAEAHHQASRFVDGMADRRVAASAARADLHAALGGELPAGGGDPVEVLRLLAEAGDAGLLNTQSPRFFGFVIGGAHPAAMAADWLTTAWDQNAGLYVASPTAAVVEHVTAGWLLDLLGLPAQASVGFVTGGQMATWTCLAAARHHVLDAAGWDVERDGLHGAPKVHIVVGRERHGTVDRALRFLGFGSGTVTTVAADEQGRMDPRALDRTLAGLEEGPAIVVAQAGNVNTGSFDPMRPICESARARGAWVHVDGAFGLWAQASRRHRHLSTGVEAADSWAVDAHKWLNVPYDSGVAVVAHPQAHQRAMGASGSYLVYDDDARHDEMNWVPEHSRRARGLATWALLRTLGRDGVEDLVDRLCAHARRFAAALADADGVEVLNDVVLNQVLVRFGHPVDPDTRTRAVIAAVQEEGTCWMGGTTWRGGVAMRISVSNWATTEADVDRSAEAILRCAAAIP